MLGGGSPVSSPVNTGATLNYVGNRVYAYSGLVAGSSSSYQTALSFETGSELILAKFQYADSTAAGDTRSLKLVMNSQTVYENVYDTSPLQYSDGTIHLIIPSFTKFTASFKIGTTTENATMQLTGVIL